MDSKDFALQETRIARYKELVSRLKIVEELMDSLDVTNVSFNPLRRQQLIKSITVNFPGAPTTPGTSMELDLVNFQPAEIRNFFYMLLTSERNAIRAHMEKI